MIFNKIVNLLGHCPKDHKWIRDRTSCYLRSHQPMTWSNAQHFCGSLGSTLVEIDNYAEQYFVSTFITGPHREFWTAGRRQSEDIFQWTWTASDEAIEKFEFWGETEPNNDGTCLSLFRASMNRKWVAANCENDYFAICEIKVHL